MARLTGYELTVQAWERLHGREGLWCKVCRRATPTYLLVPCGRDAHLWCESCGITLAVGESWLAEVARQLPAQKGAASVVP